MKAGMAKRTGEETVRRVVVEAETAGAVTETESRSIFSMSTEIMEEEAESAMALTGEREQGRSRVQAILVVGQGGQGSCQGFSRV